MLNTRQSSIESDLLDIRRGLAAFNVHVKCVRLIHVLRKYSPDQPRMPAGTPEGGQWTSGGGGGGAANEDGTDASEDADWGAGSGLDGEPRVQLAEADSPYNVDLEEHGRLGGHTISLHVGVSETTLIGRTLERSERFLARGDWFTGLSEGSFTSLDAATELVNATLAENHDAVDTVARGEARGAFLRASFGSRTGYEAYLLDPNSSPYIRDTNAVSVYIRHDSRAPNGFRVQSAFPSNW